jgi:hypothetical protein
MLIDILIHQNSDRRRAHHEAFQQRRVQRLAYLKKRDALLRVRQKLPLTGAHQLGVALGDAHQVIFGHLMPPRLNKRAVRPQSNNARTAPRTR